MNETEPSPPPRTPIVGVSRRFGVAHMMVAVGLFAMLFSLLEVLGVRQMHRPEIVYLACVAFSLAIPLGQAWLYQGRQPRRASCLVGSRLLPLMAVGTVAWLQLPELIDYALAGYSSLDEWAVFIVLVAGTAVFAHAIGFFLGYIVGTVSAGVFLVIDRQWDAGQVAAEAPPGQPTGETGTEPLTGWWWLDWIAWSPWKWLWSGRHRSLQLVLLTSAFVGVLFLASLLISLPLLSWPAWQKLFLVALVATLPVAFILAGMLQAGWRVSLLLCLLGILGSIVPVYLLSRSWAWIRFTSANSCGYVGPEALEIAHGLLTAATASAGVAFGLIAAGFCGWVQRVRKTQRARNTKGGGRGTALVFAAGLMVILIALGATAAWHVNSPRERAIRAILASGHITSYSSFSVDEVALGKRPDSANAFKALGTVQEITYLYASQLNVTATDVAPLGQLPNLFGLKFSECRFAEGTFQQPPRLPALESLSFDHCELAADDLAILQSCPALRELFFSGETLEASPLLHLPDQNCLVRVYLNDVTVRRDAFRNLGRVPSVCISDATITDEAWSHLGDADTTPIA